MKRRTNILCPESGLHTTSFGRILKLFLILAVMVAGTEKAMAVGNLLNIEDLVSGADKKITNVAAPWYCSNVTLFWKGGLRGNNDENIVTVDGKQYIKLSKDPNKHIKIQFDKGKVKPGDILSFDVARTTSSNNCDLGLFTVKQAGDSYTLIDPTSAVISYANSSDASKSYTLNYTIKSTDINTVDANTENIVITGFWYSSTAIHGMKIIQTPVVTFSANDAGMGTVTATVNGNAITSGSKVPAGTQVTFTATPSGTNLHWGWDGTDGRKYDGNKTVTINDDYNIVAQFNAGIHVRAYTNNGEFGDVIIKKDGKESKDFHVTPWPGEFVYVAKPAQGNRFVGWYDNVEFTGEPVSTDLSYTKSGISNQDVTLWGKFEFSSNTDLNFTEKGVKNVEWENGTLYPTAPNNNWISIKKIPADQLANYTGIQLTYIGDDSRIFLMYDGKDEKQTTTKLDAAEDPTTSYYSWSMLGLPKDYNGWVEVRFSGKQDWGLDYTGVQTTYSNVKLVNLPDQQNATIDDGYVKFNLDSRTALWKSPEFKRGAHRSTVEWVVKEVQHESATEKFFCLKTSDNKNNFVNALDFTGGYKANDYTGVRLDYKGDHVRVFVRSGDKTFQYTTEAAAEKTSLHIGWEDFANLADDGAKMTDDEIKAISAIDLSGCSAHVEEESTDIYNVWLDKMYHYTIVTGAGKGEKWNSETGVLTYSINVDGKDVDGKSANVLFQKCDGSSRHQECDGLKLQREQPDNYNNELLVTVPDGYRVSKVKFGLGEESYYNVSFNYGKSMPSGTGNVIGYIKGTGDAENGVRLVIRGAKDQTGEKQCTELHITYVTFELETVKGGDVYDTDFTGYFNYNNRLYAQWNFDLCDKLRFNEAKVKANSTLWNYESNSDGTVVYKNAKKLGTDGDDANKDSYTELTYDGADVIPVTAGLKFKAPAGAVQIRIEKDKDSKTGTKAYLVLNSGVKMYIPYVENSYRNDLGDDWQPNADKVGTNEADDPEHFENCMHHVRRDILYMSLKEGSIWSSIKNECIDNASSTLFSAGGEERVNDCHFFKMNYNGNHGVPCIMQIDKQTFIKRMGVNRNLTYSFYTEYIGDLDLDKPVPHTRILGSPSGWKVANVESTAVTYTDAIALTYGGWKTTENKNTYKSFDGTDVTDEWSELGVYNGDEKFVTYSQLAGETVTKDSRVPVATDGFPVLSHMPTPAASETLMPQGSTGKYHLESQGKFSPTDTENYTPWTLPCRGGYVKFEPAIPGVLNVDILQKGNNYTKSVGNVYFIVDEFGRNVSGVFHKTASNNQIDKCPSGGYFLQGHSDNVKYSFNVYPGKTYYIFSNDYGMGFAGYYFEPYMYRTSATDEMAREEIRMNTLTLSESTDYAYDSSLNEKHSVLVSPGKNGVVEYAVKYDNTAVEVTMDLKFTANTWGSICLPFSMNQNSMEQVFGKGTKVILLRDIQARNGEEKTTANFVMHENQDILAGYPYFIRPTKDVNGFTTNAYLYPQAGQPSIVKIASEGIDFTDAEKDFGGLEGYTFTGNFAKEILPKYSYVMSKTGKMTRLTKDTAAKPYRAFLKANPDAPDLQELSLVFFGDMPEDEEVTAVDDVVFEHKGRSASKDVYNMGGQLVRKNADSLLGLPKGTYIAGGRKYVVR